MSALGLAQCQFAAEKPINAELAGIWISPHRNCRGAVRAQGPHR
jgi:hypothetical protein